MLSYFFSITSVVLTLAIAGKGGDGGSFLDYCGLATLNGLARNGRSLRYTPRKIRRTRITRLKPCACSSPHVHKFNININTGDGGSRTRVQNDNKRESTSLESFYLNAKSERYLQPN